MPLSRFGGRFSRFGILWRTRKLLSFPIRNPGGQGKHLVRFRVEVTGFYSGTRHERVYPPRKPEFRGPTGDGYSVVTAQLGPGSRAQGNETRPVRLSGSVTKAGWLRFYSTQRDLAIPLAQCSAFSERLQFIWD